MEYTNKECPNGCMSKGRRFNNKIYDTYNRNKDSKSIYESKEWKLLTNKCARRFCYIDIYNLYVLGKVEHGTLSHHIIEVEEDKTRSYDIEDLIWLNSVNHAYIHSVYKKSDRAKKEMQKLLFDLIERWKVDYGQVGEG
jgi:hypothetical protein